MSTAFKVGDKVVPHSKSHGATRYPCKLWEVRMHSDKPYMYIVRITNNFIVLNNNTGTTSGNFYKENDIKLYNDILNKGVEL